MGQVSFWERALSERSFQWAWSLVFEAWTRGRGGQHLHVSMFIYIYVYAFVYILSVYMFVFACV